MARKYFAEEYAKMYSPHGVNMTDHVISTLRRALVDKVSELQLMIFANFIKDGINRDIKVDHISNENGITISSKWVTDWIDLHENHPIFDDLVRDIDIDECEAFENVEKILIEDIISKAINSYSSEYENEAGNGIVYMAYHNTLIVIETDCKYVNKEKIKIRYTHWYPRVSE